MQTLITFYRSLLSRTHMPFHRYLWTQVDWGARMVGIAGPRGVGKTTLLLQHAAEHLRPEDSLYVVADDLYFSSHTLLDTAQRLQQLGYRHLLIDEIHKYPSWSRELKLIYDYFPDMQVVFTASSVLDILRGEADLSRRALVYHMQGLSLREYLSLRHGISVPTYTLQQLLSKQMDTDLTAFHPLRLFEEYLQEGYYPFAYEGAYDMRLRQIIYTTLENDIPIFAKMNAQVGRKLKQMLTIVAQSVPFKPNYSKIGQEIDADRAAVKTYIHYMERAGLVMQLLDDTGGVRGLGKVEKLYVDNPSLMWHLGAGAADRGNMRETFFANQVRVKHEVRSSSIADFMVEGCTFEVGGHRKGLRQIAKAERGFIVRDDIEYAQGNSIPLWHFGLLY